MEAIRFCDQSPKLLNCYTERFSWMTDRQQTFRGSRDVSMAGKYLHRIDVMGVGVELREQSLRVNTPTTPLEQFELEKPMTTAQSLTDQLLDDLIQSHERITYKAAYAALMGPAPNDWYPSHVRQVVRLIELSKQVLVEGLLIKLDALVVNNDAPNEPSEPHFQNKFYNRSQWRSVFGSWGVRRP